MITKKEFIINGNNSLPITLDLTFKRNDKRKNIIIFCHGFKGFKDWGAWNLVAKKFAEKDFVFIKFNFSHNGTTPENLEYFDNLKAFSENNYSKELEDLQSVIDWISSDNLHFLNSEIDIENINLIGHSRGGGAVLVKSASEERIHKVCTWASIDSYDRFGTKTQIKEWKKQGEYIFLNGRTGQKMPINYQFYENYIHNIENLDIKKSLKKNRTPLLIIHGKEDAAVHIESARNIYSWSDNSELLEIENTNHVFGSKHPFQEKKLPKHLGFIVKKTVKFFQ